MPSPRIRSEVLVTELGFIPLPERISVGGNPYVHEDEGTFTYIQHFLGGQRTNFSGAKGGVLGCEITPCK